MSKRFKNFQLEIRLGLALIILVLILLNLAAHYTIFRLKESLETRLKDDLYEAAVVVANEMRLRQSPFLEDSLMVKIGADYSLRHVEIIPLNYDRVMAIQKLEPLDSVLAGLGPDLSPKDLAPVLLNYPVFHKTKGNEELILLFPASVAGSKYLVSVTKHDPLLSSIENAGRILIFFGILGIAIIVYAAGKFSSFIIRPFQRLKESAFKSGHLEPTGEDEITQVISSYEKIIKQLRAKEEQLVELNELISRKAENLEVYNNYILTSINTGVVTIDAKKKISSLNRAAADMLDVAAYPIIGKNCTDLFCRYRELQALIDRYWQTAQIVNNQKAVISNKEGRGLVLDVSISLLTDSQGSVIGTSVILNDQTEFIRLREELELKKRMASLGEMSSGLAHQLRNYAAAIMGFAKLIARKSEGIPDAAENCRHLLKECREAEELVSRFLDFARPLDIHLQSFTIGKLVDDIGAGLRETYPNVEITIADLSDGELQLNADPLLVKQAVGNIIDNACKCFSGGRGEVAVDITADGNDVEIRIRDNGPGIPDQYKDDIFTPFFSGHPSGSGLGLPLARKIVLMHGGRLSFAANPGRGTTFIISLPLGTAPRTESIAVLDNP
jgi:PAS domain S-box-containing protein